MQAGGRIMHLIPKVQLLFGCMPRRCGIIQCAIYDFSDMRILHLRRSRTTHRVRSLLRSVKVMASSVVS